jgi:hypothetical protein
MPQDPLTAHRRHASLAPMNAPAIASKHYALHFLIDETRFFWRNPNLGVSIIDAGRDSALAWTTESGEARRLWTEIAAVNMVSTSDGKAEVNQCRVEFRDGRSITLTDAGSTGTLDEEKTPLYRDFVRALHARLAQAPQGTIRFTAGVSEARHMLLTVTMCIAALLFVALPLVLLFIVRDWKVLGALAAGAGFVWPFWKIAEKNRPRSYDPRHPPGELME